MLPNDQRTITHFDLDTFFVSVERLRNSRLMGKPVIVGGMSDRSVVASCSYETRYFGVYAGRPMKIARQPCQKAIVLRGDIEAYSKYSTAVTQVIAAKAPVYEKLFIDEHYLDVSGTNRFHGTWQWTNEFRNLIIKKTSLSISFGLSINKTVSKIATDQAKPNGKLQVCSAEVKPFLAPLSIKKIPGVGQKSNLVTSLKSGSSQAFTLL